MGGAHPGLGADCDPSCLEVSMNATPSITLLLIGLRLLARSAEKRGRANVDRSALRAVKRALVVL